VLEHIVSTLDEPDLQLVQIDANLQLMGQQGTAHQDIYVGNGEDRTILFYPHHVWDESWGGDLQIINTTDVKSIYPQAGRVIYFDSTVLHKANPPTVENTPRMSIAFRMRKPNAVL
jgi:Rps23 Pro-64 3,4-dihydroxylase Tpa1-like proline 4-hydroxylase